MSFARKPLYRKVNTTAHRVHHHFGGDFRQERNRKKPWVKMKQGERRGLDYTPLYRFLLSKVGSSWSEIHREACSRLDREDPIYHLVSLQKSNARDYVRVGESTYFSGLFVDDDGLLKVVNPDINETTLTPDCKCCTHTFNGKVFTRSYPLRGQPPLESKSFPDSRE